MSDIWLLFIDKINKFNKNIARYSFSIIKNILSYSKVFSKSSIDKIEIKKLNWELKKEREKLGSYIYKCNLQNIYDFSNDATFNNSIDKIKEIENFLNDKSGK